MVEAYSQLAPPINKLRSEPNDVKPTLKNLRLNQDSAMQTYEKFAKRGGTLPLLDEMEPIREKKSTIDYLTITSVDKNDGPK